MPFSFYATLPLEILSLRKTRTLRGIQRIHQFDESLEDRSSTKGCTHLSIDDFNDPEETDPPPNCTIFHPLYTFGGLGIGTIGLIVCQEDDDKD